MSEKIALDQNEEDKKKSQNYGYGVRHVQTILMFLAMTTSIVMRVDMSVAIIAMTDNSTTLENVEIYTWNKKTQDVILSSFFWGYMLMQIPTGQLSQRYGAKVLLVTALLANGIISLATPLVVSYGGWKGICACRALQGFTQAVLFPSVHTFMSKWIPKSEQSRLGNLIYSGMHLGTIIGMPLSSLLASTAMGWPCIFYVIGSLGISVGILLWLYSANTPQNHKSITVEEMFYIESSLKRGTNKKVLKTPWKKIFTSLPLYALMIGHSGLYWGVIIFLTEIPSYFKRALGVNVKQSGFLTALPYTASLLGSIILSFISDYIINKNICSTGTARKIFNSIASWGPAMGLIILGYIPSGNEVLSVCFLTISVGLMSGMSMGYLMNHIDLSPNFAGILMGITNFIANVFGLLAPITVGYILEDDTDLNQWRIVFWVTAAIFTISNLFFIIFASGNKQSWNEPDATKITEEIGETTILNLTKNH